MRIEDLLNENEDFGDARETSSGDSIGTLKISDTRKPKLTLMALNKLRKLRAQKKDEWDERKKLFIAMYGTPEQEAGGMPGM